MDFRDFGTLIWAIFIVVAVISSILRSANRAFKNVQQPPPQAQPTRAAVPPPVPSESSSTFGRGTSDRGAGMDAGATRQTSRSESGGRATRGSEAGRTLLLPALVKRRPVRLFRGDQPLVRGIIALEVLGPPRALREWKSIV